MHVKHIITGLYDANSYLINKKVLVDTGMNTKGLVEEINRNTDMKDLELIILTHCHYDHTASAQEIAQMSGAKVAIHKDDAPLLKNDNISAAAMFGYSAPSIDADMLLEEGDRIPVGEDEELEVIHTPGHTPGGICLYEASTKSLFSGDTVFPNGSIGRTDFQGGSRSQLTESINKIMKLDVETLYPGHGEVTSNDVNRQIEFSLRMSKSIL
ncbi:MBL fold metallo-hydrolase [Methanolobus zinderi]|jgi:glyoxylase-like metal-dependent hydrolase (beta-lactamase superfamily II)|uniref:MBL fold metallo-hydrolase n=1 Tax=Methanolobus zinderi TaxID=536044 RepID=A0A7D5E7X6_9EURY|nr:MBL fold metallo-hydrolase [Methanolobus zinderi]QLC49015.1 MBL fold metallo-hydrolase [Methanolobus zinderi]